VNEAAARISEVIQAAGWLLDREEYPRWLELFADPSQYEIVARQPAAGIPAVWWRSDRAELARVLGSVREHFRDDAVRTHVVSPITMEVNGDRASAVASFAIYRSPPHEPSRLFIVGHYQDRLVKSGQSWLFSSHQVVVDSSVIDTLTHIPL
jgi:3-phenylpropionate/cinnamic acid dioxygenase small subunit